MFTYSTILRNKICRLAANILGNEDDAKDVSQEVFTKLWTKRKLFINYKNQETLALKIAKDICLDRLKHEKLKMRNLQQISYLKNQIDDTVLIEKKELGRITRDLIARLPEKQRMIIHFRDIEDMEFEEIIQIMGMDINAIRMNLSRARKTVREQILKIMNHGI